MAHEPSSPENIAAENFSTEKRRALNSCGSVSTLAVVGAGNLGLALVRAIVRSGIVTPGHLTVFERGEGTRAQLAAELGCQVFPAAVPPFSVAAPQFVILAVKPQDAEKCCAGIQELLTPESVVISVLAGVSVSTLRSYLGGHSKIVRCMPNLGSQVGSSATAFFVANNPSAEEVAAVRTVIDTFGRSWQIEDETLIDAATAIAGSGPAYFCWLAEQMILAGEQLGLEQSVAHELVLQTMRGVVGYLDDSGLTPEQVRLRVTSPNGTTAAALDVLRIGQGADLIVAAVRAAHARATELGKK